MSCKTPGHEKRIDQGGGWCRECTGVRKRKRRTSQRLGAVRRDFGWSETEYLALREAQRGADGRIRCPCGRPIDRTKEPAMDHDHAAERRGVPIRYTVRGLLCSVCNRFLGQIGDRPEALIALALHLVDPIAPKVLPHDET